MHIKSGIFFQIWLSVTIVVLLLCSSIVVNAETRKIVSAPVLKGIFLSKTFLFGTKRDFTRIAVGDSRIASVRALSTRQIIIKGLKPGWTNLTIWYNDGSQIEIFDFKVEIDPQMIADVEKVIKELVPESMVHIVPANEELLLEGEVFSLTDMHRVLQIVTAFFGSKKKGRGSKAQEGESSTSINIGDVSTGSETEGNESQLETNLNSDIAIKNNLVVIKGCQQVQLEVKIAEVSRSAMKKMGLSFLNNRDWSIGVFPTGTANGYMVNTPARTTVASTGGGIVTAETGGSNIGSGAEIASPFGAAFQLLLHSVNDNSLALLSVLKGQGLARLLATPTLVTMSGQMAKFNVGGEIPIPTTDSNGSTNIIYKEYGVLLEFTPIIIDKKTIMLNVSPEVSSPDWSLGTSSGGVAVPGIKSRKAHATLQLKDGQTFVMAGLLKEDSHVVTSKIPFLGDIPIVGTFFTSKEVEKNETELVIIVTPRLVRPLDKNEVPPLPGDEMADNVSDIDFFLLNQTGSKKKGNNTVTNRKTPAIAGGIGFER